MFDWLLGCQQFQCINVKIPAQTKRMVGRKIKTSCEFFSLPSFVCKLQDYIVQEVRCNTLGVKKINPV